MIAVFEASAAAAELAVRALAEVSDAEKKFFTTVDDW